MFLSRGSRSSQCIFDAYWKEWGEKTSNIFINQNEKLQFSSQFYTLIKLKMYVSLHDLFFLLLLLLLVVPELKDPMKYYMINIPTYHSSFQYEWVYFYFVSFLIFYLFFFTSLHFRSRSCLVPQKCISIFPCYAFYC